MKIAVIGTGAVGLVTSVGFAVKGNQVVGVDNNPAKIAGLQKGIPTIYEDDLEKLLVEQIANNKISFTSDLGAAVSAAQIVFVAVGTPMGDDGAADLSQVRTVAKELGAVLKPGQVVVLKSTCPVGTTDEFAALLEEASGTKQDVVFNPEFLRQGNAVEDVLNPDRVVLGGGSAEAQALLRELYNDFVPKEKILMMSRRSAELTKYAANVFLATKITYMNELSRYADAVGADIEEVKAGIGSDNRISPKFLNAGLGYGGSCFPKDVSALIHAGRKAGVKLKVVESVDQVNKEQQELPVKYLLEELGLDAVIADSNQKVLQGMTVALWGLSFKPNTDDLRGAPSRKIVERLLALGASVRAYDPRAMEQARQDYPNEVYYAIDPLDAAKNAQALILVTEWDVFKDANLDQLANSMQTISKQHKLVIIDGRNLLDPSRAIHAGFKYRGIGRGSSKLSINAQKKSKKIEEIVQASK